MDLQSAAKAESAVNDATDGRRLPQQGAADGGGEAISVPAPSRYDFGDLLALGFGTTVAIWGAGYALRLPHHEAPALVLFILIILAFLVGGFLGGRYARRGAVAGLYSGLISAGLNLILFNTLLLRDANDHLRPHWWLGLVGFVVAAGLLGWIGGAIGRAFASTRRPNWKAALSMVAVAAACILLLAGGMVTAFDAGMAVPDWPNSFGFNMFLYPVARMAGGVYYEHFHRLIASFLGLTLTVIAVYLLYFDRRRWMKCFGVGLFVAIVIQGIIGGMRVRLGDINLALLHGIVAQLIFATLAVGVVFATRRFEYGPPARVDEGASSDRGFTGLLVAALLLQLVMGSFVRHKHELVLMHVSFAAVVALLCLLVGLRMAVVHGKIKVLRRFGIALLVLVVVQIIAGIAALVVLPLPGPLHTAINQSLYTMPHRTITEALITTLHQTNGAVLLATATCTAAWVRRLLKSPA